MLDGNDLSGRRYGQRRIDILPKMVRGPDGQKSIRSADLESILVQSRNLSLLMDVVRSIMTEMDLGSLLDRIMRDVTLVMNADRSTLFLLDRASNEIWSRVAQGDQEIRLPRGSGIAGEVIEKGLTLNIGDAYADSRFFQEHDRKTGYRTKTILCAPIHNPHAEIIGAIQILNKKDGHDFTQEDEKLISAFASLAGIALANALSYETLERLVEERTADLIVAGEVAEEAARMAERARTEVERLNEFARSLNENPDMGLVMDQIFAFLVVNYGIEWSMVQTVDESEAIMKTVKVMHAGQSTRELIDKAQAFRPELSEASGTVYGVWKRGRSFYLPSAARLVSHAQDRFLIQESGFQSLLIVPLLLQGRVSGLIYFAWFDPQKRLSRPDRKALEGFCDQIAGVVHTSSLLEQVSTERDRSDRLLLNILPRHVADELKTSGSVRPARHEHVTILFTDFVGFTKVARTVRPEELIEELDRIFLQFDLISERNGIEKLKTIGDAYMCAGGLPVASPTHAVDACLAALEIREFMEETRRIKREITKEDFWQIRIGIHSGPVVAGVIGKNRFAYDIWGDSVNVASRMEAGGAPGEINISRETRDLVEPFFECEYRGVVAIKNRGEVEMYFLRRIRQELSRGGTGRVPAENFWEARRLLGQTP